MFDSDDVSAFNAEVVAASTAAFPTVVFFRGKNLTVKCTAIKRTREIEPGGFVPENDGICRIPVDLVISKPLVGEELIVRLTSGDIICQIESVALPTTLPEYVLGLKAT